MLKLSDALEYGATSIAKWHCHLRQHLGNHVPGDPENVKGVDDVHGFISSVEVLVVCHNEVYHAAVVTKPGAKNIIKRQHGNFTTFLATEPVWQMWVKTAKADTEFNSCMRK